MTSRPVITPAGNETAAILHLSQIERTGKSRKLTAADLIPLGIDDSSRTRINRPRSGGTDRLDDKKNPMTKHGNKLYVKYTNYNKTARALFLRGSRF